MAVGWRPVLALAVAAGCAVTLGTVPASAAELSTGKCVADGHRAEVGVKYRRVDADIYIGSVALTIDKQAGNKNKVRIVVRRDGESQFTYNSGANVTAGPYLFDYRDHPIRVRLSDESEEIQVDATVDFDAKDGGDTSCTATVTF